MFAAFLRACVGVCVEGKSLLFLVLRGYSVVERWSSVGIRGIQWILSMNRITKFVDITHFFMYNLKCNIVTSLFFSPTKCKLHSEIFSEPSQPFLCNPVSWRLHLYNTNVQQQICLTRNVMLCKLHFVSNVHLMQRCKVYLSLTSFQA